MRSAVHRRTDGIQSVYFIRGEAQGKRRSREKSRKTCFRHAIRYHCDTRVRRATRCIKSRRLVQRPFLRCDRVSNTGVPAFQRISPIERRERSTAFSIRDRNSFGARRQKLERPRNSISLVAGFRYKQFPFVRKNYRCILLLPARCLASRGSDINLYFRMKPYTPCSIYLVTF